jgi:D-alanine-D-alanine ligase-like ATP-grasp enzyme
VSEIAKRAYEVLKMKGFSRSEFILVNGEPHMLEMNTIQVNNRKFDSATSQSRWNFTGGFVY